jgi:hypothetical protein
VNLAWRWSCVIGDSACNVSKPCLVRAFLFLFFLVFEPLPRAGASQNSARCSLSHGVKPCPVQVLFLDTVTGMVKVQLGGQGGDQIKVLDAGGPGITETNGMHLVLFCTQNWTFLHPYPRVLDAVGPVAMPGITESNGMHVV